MSWLRAACVWTAALAASHSVLGVASVTPSQPRVIDQNSSASLRATALVDAATLASVRSQITAHREALAYGIVNRENTSPRHEAINAHQGYRVHWTNDGWVELNVTRGAVGQIKLRTEGLGRSGWMMPLPSHPAWHLSSREGRQQRVDRVLAPGVSEWWLHGPEGASHWVQLADRPAGVGRLEVTLALDARGYRVRIDGEGERARLLLTNDSGTIRYEGLKAWDARGVTLPVSLAYDATIGRLTYKVDDLQARYPITVDPTWTQQAYIKASNSAPQDQFGSAVAISADGNTLAVSAFGEDSNATGVNGDQTSNGAVDSGAVYVFVRSGGIWSQQAYIKASNTEADDVFGSSVALSADGNTLAVGAVGEDSNATGIDGNQADNSQASSGAVYVFTRSGVTWSQQAYIKASNPEGNDRFGASVALASDGNTLAVGAHRESSGASGVNGNQADNSVTASGAVYVFVRSGVSWSQQAYVKASNPGTDDYFGLSVALSADGNTLAVGAPGEASSATGVNGDQSDNSSPGSGAVYVLTRSGVTWAQQAYLKASNAGSWFDAFGQAVAISADGNTLAVGAPFEDSAATGINGNQSDESALQSGAVYAFTRSGVTWSQQAYVKASNTEADDNFGSSVALSGNGNALAAGSRGEDSSATGINGTQADNSAIRSGAVYTFARTGTAWAQSAYVKASNTGVDDYFGYALALSADGNTLAVGAIDEASNATGINGNQVDDSAPGSGAVYAFVLPASSPLTPAAAVPVSSTWGLVFLALLLTLLAAPMLRRR